MMASLLLFMFSCIWSYLLITLLMRLSETVILFCVCAAGTDNASHGYTTDGLSC